MISYANALAAFFLVFAVGFAFGCFIFQRMTEMSMRARLTRAYQLGKFVQNSLYDKLVKGPSNYYDYKIMPLGSFICEFVPAKDDKICAVCGEPRKEHGWQLALKYDLHEIHRRPSSKHNASVALEKT